MADWIIRTIESSGYFGIVFLMFLENVFPPIPSEIIMPLAGFIVSKGERTFLGVVLSGTIGSVLGALPLYYAGYFIGERRLERFVDEYGRWLTISRKDLEKAKKWFDRHGRTAVLLCRLVPGVRSLISIPAGIKRMPIISFLGYTEPFLCRPCLRVEILARSYTFVGSLLWEFAGIFQFVKSPESGTNRHSHAEKSSNC